MWCLKMESPPQHFFGNTFGCFWCGPKFFRPPRTQNPHFRPQKFLQGTDFRRKMLFFGCFVNVVHQKVSGTTQLFGAQKHVYVLGYLKKSPKRAWNEYWHPKGTLKILGKNLIFSKFWLWVNFGCAIWVHAPFVSPFFENF